MKLESRKSGTDLNGFRYGYEFPWSGWHTWFSTRKWMKYKLPTQGNQYTASKPVSGILEYCKNSTKHFRSYFADFLLENCKRYRIAHGAKYEVHFLLMDIEVVVTIFKEPQCFSIGLFETAQFTGRIAPNSCQGQPTKCHLNKCKVLKWCCLFVCRWLLIDPSKKKDLKDKNMLFMTYCWKSWLLKENRVEQLGFFKLLGCPPLHLTNPFFLSAHSNAREVIVKDCKQNIESPPVPL